MANLFTKIPLLRFLLPLTIGIILSCTQLHYYIAIGILVFGVILYYITSKSKKPYIQYTINYRYYLSLFCIIMAFGWINSSLLTSKEVDLTHFNSHYAIGVIQEIKDKDNSMTAIVNVVSHIDTCGNQVSMIPTKVKTNIEGVNFKLKIGDIICYHANYEKLINLNNPDEFDYAGFMARKGIYYNQYLKDKKYEIIGHNSSLFTIASHSQNKLVTRILQSNLKPTTQEFLITILLGDNMIDKDIQQEFSKAGIAHILALSGLHVAIIMLIISIILYPLDKFRLRNTRLIITLIIIIVYAFITGLSPSVVRATIMATFFIISFILYRKNTSLNALCGAAILILVIAPMEMYSVGFQLSFAAVASILIFSRYTARLLPKNKIGYYLCSLIIVSISSMIGTGIISAYYFHSIPVLFLIGNMIIIPLLPVILGGAIFYLILPIDFIGTILDFFYESIRWFISSINSIEFSSINNLNITFCDIILFYSLTITILIFIRLKRPAKALLSSLLIAIVWVVVETAFPRVKQETGLVVFNDYTNTPVLYYENSTGYLLFNNELDDIEQFRKYHLKFLLNRGINDIMSVPDSIGKREDIYINNPYICVNGKRFAIISKNIAKNRLPLTNKINIDYLIITKHYYGKIEKLLNLYKPSLVVISGNIYPHREKILTEECQSLNLKYKSIGNEGALQVIFQ